MYLLRLDLTVFTGSTLSNLTVCYEREAEVNTSEPQKLLPKQW